MLPARALYLSFLADGHPSPATVGLLFICAPFLRPSAEFDFGKSKAFPMRDQHFFASIDKVRGPAEAGCRQEAYHMRDTPRHGLPLSSAAVSCNACSLYCPPCCATHKYPILLQAMADLDWAPEFGLLEGLQDSYDKDFGRGTYRKEPDYTAGEPAAPVYCKCDSVPDTAPTVSSSR